LELELVGVEYSSPPFCRVELSSPSRTGTIGPSGAFESCERLAGVPIASRTNGKRTVGRRENKALRAEGDDRLVGSKHLWLYGKENLASSNADVETKLAFAKLRSSNLKTSRAWALQESLRDL
jgi:Transposase